MVNLVHILVGGAILLAGGYLIYRAYNDSKKKKEEVSPLTQVMSHPEVRKSIKEALPQLNIDPKQLQLDLPPKAVSTAHLGRYMSYW